MIIRELLQEAEQQLLAADLFYGHGTDNAWDEAVVLVLHALNLPIDIDANIADESVDAQSVQAVRALIHRRIAERMPAPYLTGKAYFAGLCFHVDHTVLIPRSPFAELIFNGFEPWVNLEAVEKILEIGTGSGCIAVALAKQCPHVHVDAVDISEKALKIAHKNVQAHGVSEQVSLIASDLFSSLDQHQQYGLIVSNPPYVDAEDMAALPQEYHHEPKDALAAGPDGLALVDRLLREAKDYLSDDGILVIEVGNSAFALEKKYPHIPFTWIEFENGGEGVFVLTRQDLNGF